MGIPQIYRLEQKKLLGFDSDVFQANLKKVFWYPSLLKRKAYKRSRRKLLKKVLSKKTISATAMSTTTNK